MYPAHCRVRKRSRPLLRSCHQRNPKRPSGCELTHAENQLANRETFGYSYGEVGVNVGSQPMPPASGTFISMGDLDRCEEEIEEQARRLTFLALLVILALVFPFLSDKLNPQLTWLMAATAGITGGCLRLLGLAARVSGRIVTLPNFSIEVVGECTGLYEMLIFLAAVIAYPAGWRKKILGAGLGIPLLYVINIVRMVFITAVGNWSPGTFEFMHLYFWQVAMILIIVAVWVLWIEKVVHRERKAVVVHS